MIEGYSLKDKEKLLQSMVQTILAKGIVIQDVERGLIDFPSWKEEREILLCYELADGEKIGFWHELDGGYAGRQEI